jgi:hypothetical protein
MPGLRGCPRVSVEVDKRQVAAFEPTNPNFLPFGHYVYFVKDE